MDSKLQEQLNRVEDKLDWLIDVVYKAECAEYERKKKEYDNKINTILLNAAKEKRAKSDTEKEKRAKEHERFMNNLNGGMNKYKKGGK